jgi:hypothetical protein
VTLRDGSTFLIDVEGALTVGDVLNRLNQARPSTFVAALNSTNTGIDLTDRSTPVKEHGVDKFTFTVEAARDVRGQESLAGDGLGILGKALQPTAQVPDARPDVIKGSPLQSGSIVDHFFIQATPNAASAQFGDAGTVGVEARIGADKVNLSAGLGFLTLGIKDGSVSVDARTASKIPARELAHLDALPWMNCAAAHWVSS